MKHRMVSMEVKKVLHDGMYCIVSESWMWNESQRSKIQQIEMSDL